MSMTLLYQDCALVNVREGKLVGCKRNPAKNLPESLYCLIIGDSASQWTKGKRVMIATHAVQLRGSIHGMTVERQKMQRAINAQRGTEK